MPRPSNFKVGLFVLIGVGLALGAAAYLGAGDYLKDAVTYETFFDESVQGLQVDSAVKFRGVAVGRVREIRVAPDYRLISVVMDLEIKENPTKAAIAQIKSAGITGISYIGLDLIKPGELEKSPKLNFAAEYPVIPSKPSEIRTIFSSLQQVAEDLKTVDFKSMAEDVQQTVRGARNLINSPKIAEMLTNLRDTSARLKAVVTQAESYMDQRGKVGEILNHTDDLVKQAGESAKLLTTTIADARALINQAEDELKKAGLARTVHKTENLIDGLNDDSAEIAESLKITLDELRQATRGLQGLIKRLELKPSDILFSRKPVERKPNDH